MVYNGKLNVSVAFRARPRAESRNLNFRSLDSLRSLGMTEVIGLRFQELINKLVVCRKGDFR